MEIKQTTVNGYKFRKVKENIWEKERWVVGKPYDNENVTLYYGDIVKISFKPAKYVKPINFWFCEKRKRFGGRDVLLRSVSDTRDGALKSLIKLTEGKELLAQ